MAWMSTYRVLLPTAEWEDLVPVVLHAHDCPAFRGRGVERLVELADGGIAVVSPLPYGIGVVNKKGQSERGFCLRSSHCSIALVAVGVAKSSNRTKANVFMDADRLARTIVDKRYLWQGA